MAPQSLTIQVLPPSHFRGDYRVASNTLRGGSSPSHTRRWGREVSELQRKYDDVVRRVVGGDNVGSLPLPLPPRFSTIEVNQDAAGADDDAMSDYGDSDGDGGNCGDERERQEPRISMAAPAADDQRKAALSSYTKLATLNPYALGGKNVAWQLADKLGEHEEQEQGQGQEQEEGEKHKGMGMTLHEKERNYDDVESAKRRQDAEMDRACAAVLAEEAAAKKALEGWLSRLGDER
ncbi:hypothetical protein F5Y14DRAFT_451320 [Nemania sp. NC0429]|nr:hypothetical protein F5Y14DRAFT_451320 [Nemania sp. NC0429]